MSNYDIVTPAVYHRFTPAIYPHFTPAVYPRFKYFVTPKLPQKRKISLIFPPILDRRIGHILHPCLEVLGDYNTYYVGKVYVFKFVSLQTRPTLYRWKKLVKLWLAWRVIEKNINCVRVSSRFLCLFLTALSVIVASRRVEFKLMWPLEKEFAIYNELGKLYYNFFRIIYIS